MKAKPMPLKRLCGDMSTSIQKARECQNELAELLKQEEQMADLKLLRRNALLGTIVN